MLNRNIPLFLSFFRQVMDLGIPIEDIYYDDERRVHQLIIPKDFFDNEEFAFSMTKIIAKSAKYRDDEKTSEGFSKPFMTYIPTPRADIEEVRYTPITEVFEKASINPFDTSSFEIFENTFSTENKNFASNNLLT